MKHPFSEAYIPMVMAAAEIQAMRAEAEVFFLGDWFRGDYGPELYDRSTLYIGESSAWLPLLDQLLNMLPPFYPPARMANPFLSAEGSGQMGSIITPPQYHNRFEQVAALTKKYRLDDIDDEHELALCVVMREKFGKVWRDGKWQKQ